MQPPGTGQMQWNDESLSLLLLAFRLARKGLINVVIDAHALAHSSQVVHARLTTGLGANLDDAGQNQCQRDSYEQDPDDQLDQRHAASMSNFPEHASGLP